MAGDGDIKVCCSCSLLDTYRVQRHNSCERTAAAAVLHLEAFEVRLVLYYLNERHGGCVEKKKER